MFSCIRLMAGVAVKISERKRTYYHFVIGLKETKIPLFEV